jgi:ubiquinol-cytochrome c reductase cytochrome c subunit
VTPRRAVLLAGALVCGALALAQVAAPGSHAQATSPGAPASAGQIALGRRLYVDGCSSCHGLDARGRPDRAPSLHGVGAAAADFYLSTGRMPLDDPNDQPVRTKPAYSRAEIAALTAYVASLGPGPGIPAVHPERGSLSAGLRAFTDHCAGCHQVVAQGGILTGAQAPALQEATAAQIGEAVRVGPYLMPRFGERQIDQAELDSIARYVLSTRHPHDEGGWGIGHIGPIPEGMVTWLLAMAALLLTIRFIGERTN